MVALNPAYAPAKSTSRTKNRVGDFFVRGGERVGFDQSASRVVIGEKYDASPRMASGHSKFASGAFGSGNGTTAQSGGGSGSGVGPHLRIGVIYDSTDADSGRFKKFAESTISKGGLAIGADSLIRGALDLEYDARHNGKYDVTYLLDHAGKEGQYFGPNGDVVRSNSFGYELVGDSLKADGTCFLMGCSVGGSGADYAQGVADTIGRRVGYSPIDIEYNFREESGFPALYKLNVPWKFVSPQK